MVIELRMYFCGEFFRNNLRSMRRFYGAHLFSKSANSIFKILIDYSVLGMILKVSNPSRLLVSVMLHCSQIFSVDFLVFLLKHKI